MQFSASLDASSAWPGTSAPLTAASREGYHTRVDASEHPSDYIPSGFPRSGDYGVPTPASTRHHETLPSAVGGGVSSASGDSVAAAEWGTLYGASSPMLQATAAAFRAGSPGVSFMTPIFHLTAHDATILSMEHNNHCKLLAIATSRNEILVTWTQLMPVIENMGALRAPEDDFFGGDAAPPMDERLLEWDPATMSILIDELPYTCVELSWAPWQQGIYLAGLCPGHGIRIYRYSHGHWALDDCIGTTESTSCAISKHFTVACACSRGRVELWSRGAAGVAQPAAGVSHGGGGERASSGVGVGGSSSSTGSEWALCHTVTLPIAEEEEVGNGGGGGATSSRAQDGLRGGGGGSSSGVGGAAASGSRHHPHHILGVGWDESGALLAVGDQGGAVHVLSVSQEGTHLGEVVFHLAAADGAGPCRQVAWAPSSGRSFLSLAMVFANCVRVVLFRRPRFMNAAGMPHPGHGGGRATVAASGGSGGGGGNAAGGALQVLTSALVPCEEVAKISWNGTGTRFVTSHLDSSVNIWAVDVRYKSTATSEGTERDSAGAADRAANRGSEGGRGGSVVSEKRLNLVVSVRRTSSVHPYHAASS